MLNQRAIVSSFLLYAIGTVVLACAARCDAADISFRNDVMAVLSKAGCNLGTCHGNARGKGGFQISLRGQDPDADYLVLTHDLFGRRTNSGDPDRSLLLLKPSMQMAHEGGKRFSIDSPEYQILREWISVGMPDDLKDRAQLVKLDVTPQEVYLSAADGVLSDSATGWRQQVIATARFSDGTVRDVSSVAVYETSRPIAEVSHDGLVTGHTVGETTVLVRFLNQQTPVRIAFLPTRADVTWSGPEPANFVDELVFAKLKQLQMNPSPVCDDATFIRRLSLDLLGHPPSADEARRFVADRSLNKRETVINDMLERPEFAEWWALKWADLLRLEEKTLDQKGVENFHAWLRDAFVHGKPLDQFAREIVAGRGSTYEVPPANFYRALRTPFERSEAVGQLFLGVRLQCSKCHNHPFDQWTQDDYYSWGNVFARVDYKILENRRRDSNDKHEFDGEQIVFLNETGEAKDPRTNRARAPKFLGDAAPLNAAQDPLVELGNWLTDAQHDRFVQMLANRTWQQVMGMGIVDPVDDFRATNPASNPQLLQTLAKRMANGDSLHSSAVSVTAHASDSRSARANGAFDLRSYLRVILNSKVYQLSSEANETNQSDEINFSRAIVRRHSAEQLLDSISQVLELPLQFSRVPSGRRAAQLPGVTGTRSNSLTDADRFLKLFGKPPRLQSCDCERSDETTLGQTFQLVSGGLINQMLAHKGNRLDKLLASNQTTGEMITDLYWATLTRPPADEELQAAMSYLARATSPRTAFEDLMWGLFNSNEFLLRR
ncbi:DUF1549 domain-containing protein [Schlesneria paludicola]|uniref:DUF1549 domain-containing protein n=1 Tax=Schlesneria paludicola TaxID=360056 RepID=UPI0004925CB0|nr:DUF1549 domain-containing protein [Schlesneria paludicola]